MRLFAERVLPTLQRDPAFAGTGVPDAVASPGAAAKENVFAPA
jgi:hypothetical protein